MAVYTQVSPSLLEAFVADYDIGALSSYRGIAEGVENTSYFVKTRKSAYILTLYEERIGGSADLTFSLALMQHLRDRGIPCPEPIADRHGQTSKFLAGQPASLISHLLGSGVVWPLQSHCRAVGESLARFHLAGNEFKLSRPNMLSIRQWWLLFHEYRPYMNRIFPGLDSEIMRELHHLEGLWPDSLPMGFIHADLFPDNVLFQGNYISGIIDFCSVCGDIFAYDIAICICAWCFSHDMRFEYEKAHALLEGYERVRPLQKDERKSLIVLARGASLRFILTRLHDWFNIIPHNIYGFPRNPGEYLLKLRVLRTVEGI